MVTKLLALTLPGYGADPTGIQVEAPSGIPSPKDIDLGTIITFTLNGLIAAAIILALAFLIWGGFTWITSGGEKEKVDKARKTIIMAIVGLVLAFIALILVRFIGTLLDVNSVSTLGAPTTQQSGQNTR